MILSVSRRTDIPAFYGEWFMNRLRQGYAYVRNPMNSSLVSAVPLTPENIDCIVFWTKDARAFIKRLDEIDEMKYKYYFQFTITGYGNDVESGIKDKQGIIRSFQDLSERLGKEHVILRYDPVFVTEDNKYDIRFQIKAFNELCDKLCQYTERVVFSFLDGYRKIAKNMRMLRARELNTDEMIFIAEAFSNITSKLGLRLETCAESLDLSGLGITHSRCIDGDLIERLIGWRILGKNLLDGNRENCGCMKSIDIGQYDTCVHNCLYCYANISKEKARINCKSHDPGSPILSGGFDAANVKARNERDTRSLKCIK